MKLYLFLVVGGIIVSFTLLSPSWVDAQGGKTGWTQPYRLSSQRGQVGNEIIFADSFGFVHLFWPEIGLADHQTILYYSRFDGETWTLPVDIILAPAATSISATADIEGKLHVLFTNESNGDVYYSEASIQDATSANGWQSPIRLEVSAQSISFQVDSTGNFHLLYSGFARNEPGIYYTKSVDNGQTWSKPVWIDQDIPPDLSPKQIQLELGNENSLHAFWYYWDQKYLGRWIRYANSFDQGQSWSVPFTVDKVEAGSDELRLPWPSMAVHGEEVHLIWAGDFSTHRKHRFSLDSGRTWSQAEFIFGDLLGQAIGDGLAVDALGMLHFFGQIRYPQGIYHAYWNQGRWSSPSLVYLIAQDAFEARGERIHAHRVRAAVRVGNQIVVTFTTSPDDPQSILYEMHMNMPDVPASEILPFPEQVVTPTIDTETNLISPTSNLETPTNLPILPSTLVAGSKILNSPSNDLLWAILPVVLLIAGILAIQFFNNKNS